MTNFKRARNLWIFSGFAFLIAAVTQIKSTVGYAPYLSGITSILAFLNAYINHKKYREDN